MYPWDQGPLTPRAKRVLVILGVLLVVMPFWALSDRYTSRSAVPEVLSHEQSAASRKLLQTADEADKKIIDFTQDVPRYSFSFKKTGKLFAPNDSKYREGIILTAAPWILYSILFFLFGILFCFGRCCNCCGGRNASEGCCCPSNRRRVYTGCNVTCSKVVMYITFLLGCCAMALGYWANARFSDDISTFGDVVLATASGVLDDATSLSNNVDSIDSASASLKADVAEIVTDLDKINTDLIDFEDEVDEKYNKYRKWGILALLAVCLLLLFFGAIGALTNSGNLAFTFSTIIAYFFVLLLGIIAAVHFALLVISGDFCLQVVEMIEADASTTAALDAIVECPSPSEAQSAIDELESLFTTLLNSLNQQCNPSPCNPSFTRSNYADILDRPDSGLQNRADAEELVNNCDAAISANTTTTALLNCEFLGTMYRDLEQPMCDRFLNDTLFLAISLTVYMLLFLFSVWASTVGKKRWQRNSTESVMTKHQQRRKTDGREMYPVNEKNDPHNVYQNTANQGPRYNGGSSVAPAKGQPRVIHPSSAGPTAPRMSGGYSATYGSGGGGANVYRPNVSAL